MGTLYTASNDVRMNLRNTLRARNICYQVAASKDYSASNAVCRYEKPDILSLEIVC